MEKAEQSYENWQLIVNKKKRTRAALKGELLQWRLKIFLALAKYDLHYIVYK